MAVKKYQTKKGVFYEAYAYVDGKYYHKKGFRNKTEAQRWVDTNRIMGVPKESGDMTYREVYEEWYQTYKLTVKPVTYYKVANHFKLHILPSVGNLKIGKIKMALCQKLANDWAIQLVENRRIFNYFHRIFRYAKKVRYISEDPCEFVVVPNSQVKVDDDSKHYYTSEELNIFLEACKLNYRPHAYAMFRVFALAGLRRQEVLALEWSDIDFAKKTISISKALSIDHNKNMVTSDVKTKASKAILSIDDETINALRIWKLQNQDKRVFPFSINHPRKVMVEILKDTDLPNIRLHDLRHTMCTLLIQSGANVKDVQKRMRHADIRTTLEVYAHFQQDDSALVDDLAKLITNSSPVKSKKLLDKAL